MTRVRRRLARTPSADRAWAERRPRVIADHPDLTTAEEFWRQEPDVPDALRQPVRKRWLLATRPDDVERLRADYEDGLDARRAWLRRHR